MQFVLLIYHGTQPLPGSDRWKALPQDEQKKIYEEYAEIGKTPGLTAGLPLGLPQAARTVQIREGKAEIKNGPYFSEGVTAFNVLEAENIEAAIELAKRYPAARLGGAVEVRPAEKFW